MAKKKDTSKKTVDTLKHTDAKRTHIPTAEFESVMKAQSETPKKVRYQRNTDLDPQLVWRGKDEQDWSDLVVSAPPLYIQEKVHPKVLIDDLLARTAAADEAKTPSLFADMYADFNGLPDTSAKTEFYHHESNWSNRMILGDSLQVMASLAEREGLRGKVQCIYFDPPYGIKFNSNFQWSTTSRDVKDGNREHISREPEQVKAFRDTWRDGIHSYLTYLRDRLTVARDLLTDSGSIFVQIGDENVHRVRAVLDEVFGEDNCVCVIVASKTTGASSDLLGSICDYIVWYAKNKASVKYRQLYTKKVAGEEGATGYTKLRLPNGVIRPMTLEEKASLDNLPPESKILATDNITSQRPPGDFPVTFKGKTFVPVKGYWKTGEIGFQKLLKADRVADTSGGRLSYVRYLNDFPAFTVNNVWADTVGQNQFGGDKIYVVQTANRIIERCLLMATDPGDLVLDPTCGSGTTAFVAEQWGRRWITIDTSRVALALARARIMGARYPYYLLADSIEGQFKEGEVTRTAPSTQPVRNSIRHGFVYERVPHITLKSIANNAEIDVIWEKWQASIVQALKELSQTLTASKTASSKAKSSSKNEVISSKNDVLSSNNDVISSKNDVISSKNDVSSRENQESSLENQQSSTMDSILKEWEVPSTFDESWPKSARAPFESFRAARIARQKEIDASIAAKAEFEYLYDKPYDDKKKVRVAGPFTVESLSPFRVLGVDENDELIDPKAAEDKAEYGAKQTFPQMILENLKTAGVQQAHKTDRIDFTSLKPWPGELICAEGRYMEGETERRAGIFIGPEFGTVTRTDLLAATREAGDADFDVLIACAFSYEARCTGLDKIGSIQILRARMNADLHMAEDLKNTGKGNLFVIFGEPDIEITKTKDAKYQVKIKGVDVFHPQTGEVRSDGAEGIACWFIDTNYNEESFFVRHAYFLGANDPYSALKTTLKAEINEEAWATLHSDTSRAFGKPETGRIAVKVINHLGDEVMKVFKVL